MKPQPFTTYTVKTDSTTLRFLLGLPEIRTIQVSRGFDVSGTLDLL